MNNKDLFLFIFIPIMAKGVMAQCTYMPYEKMADSSVYIGEIEIDGESTKVLDQIKGYGDFVPEFQIPSTTAASYIVFIDKHADSLTIAGCHGEGLLKSDSEFVYFHEFPWFENKKIYDHYVDHLFKPNQMRKDLFKSAIMRTDITHFDSVRVHKDWVSDKPSKWPIYLLGFSMALASTIAYFWAIE